jgi:hypothetical protein
MVEAQYNLNCQ